MRITALLLAALVAGVGEVHAAPWMNSTNEIGETGTPSVLESVGFDQKIGSQVPLDLELRDSSGEAVRFRDLVGDRPVILQLAYFDCPMLCDLTIRGLLTALRALELEPGVDFDLVTLSIDPAETSESARKSKNTFALRYDRNGADTWRFLTGNEPEIRAVADAIGFRYVYDERVGQWAHAAGVVILTPDGKVARTLLGIEPPARDLRLALVEAGEGRVGGVFDQALLYCFQYDPSTGRYSGAAIAAIRAGGALTLFGLVTFIVVSTRRERRSDSR